MHTMPKNKGMRVKLFALMWSPEGDDYTDTASAEGVFVNKKTDQGCIMFREKLRARSMFTSSLVLDQQILTAAKHNRADWTTRSTYV